MLIILVYVNSRRRSQYCGVVEAGRCLWRSCKPVPVLEQGHLDQVSQDSVQLGSAYIRGWRLHNLSGWPVPVFDHAHRRKKKGGGGEIFFSLCLNVFFPVFQFVPIASCPCAWTMTVELRILRILRSTEDGPCFFSAVFCWFHFFNPLFSPDSSSHRLVMFDGLGCQY